MKQELRDGAQRKSNRQRVPNSFYTEGINELKKPLPKIVKQASKRKSRVFQDDSSDEHASFNDEKIDLSRESQQWFNCKLPKSNSSIKVQFHLQNYEEKQRQKEKERERQKEKERKKDETKVNKKTDSTDLLSMFQRAIENVNEQVELSVPHESEPPQRQVRPKYQHIMKRRVDEQEGRIIDVEIMNNKLILKHSKLGQYDFPMSFNPETTDSLDQDLIQNTKQRLKNCKFLSTLSIFG